MDHCKMLSGIAAACAATTCHLAGAIGQSYQFNVGQVTLNEPQGNSGIKTAETDDLGVTASFMFDDPLCSVLSFTANPVVAAGSINDSHVDYTLAWVRMTVAFGAGGLFQVSMAALSFADRGYQIQTATITLTRLPDLVLETAPPVPEPAAQVAEPATAASFSLGLLGVVAMTRRRRSDWGKFPNN